MLRLRAGAFIQMIVRRVQFAADNVFYPFLYALFGKIQTRVHIPVIGDCAGVDPVLMQMIDQIVHARRAVEQTVFRMQMSMYEVGHNYPSVSYSSSVLASSVSLRSL